MDMKHPSQPRINVTIERLVLRGFAAEQRDGIAAGLIAELRNQFSDPATAPQFRESQSRASVRAAPVALASPATPRQIGARGARQLARSIRS